LINSDGVMHSPDWVCVQQHCAP